MSVVFAGLGLTLRNLAPVAGSFVIKLLESEGHGTGDIRT